MIVDHSMPVLFLLSDSSLSIVYNVSHLLIWTKNVLPVVFFSLEYYSDTEKMCVCILVAL